MNPSLAEYVHPVFRRGLELKRQVDSGGGGDLDLAQRELLDLLKREVPSRLRGDVEGDGTFLGLRYALVCWLDEIFVMDSPWSALWRAKSLERSLYGGTLAARQFWTQAEMALKGRGDDVVEVFFLAVMLGFRGRFRDDPEKLKAEFVDPARRALKRSLNRKMEEPRKRVPPSNVPPLRARDRFQRMVLAWLLTVVPLVIAVAAVYLLRNR